MRIVAGKAVALRARMLDLRLLDLIRLIRVAGYAERFRIGAAENDFSVLGRRVTDFAGLVGKRRMRELLQQLGFCRLMRIVALDAVRPRKGLMVMRLLECRVFRVVTIE